MDHLGGNELSGGNVLGNHGGDHRHIGFCCIAVGGQVHLGNSSIVVLNKIRFYDIILKNTCGCGGARICAFSKALGRKLSPTYPSAEGIGQVVLFCAMI